MHAQPLKGAAQALHIVVFGRPSIILFVGISMKVATKDERLIASPNKFLAGHVKQTEPWMEWIVTGLLNAIALSGCLTRSLV